MSTTAGYFDETALQNIRARIEDFTNWDVNVQKQYQPFADTLKFIMKQQTAKFTQIENPKKDNVLEVEWLNACGLEDQECTECTMGGNELSSNIQELSLNLCREVPFFVKESTFLANDFDMEEAVAKGFMAADKLIVEWINQQGVAVIAANTGVNAFTGGKGTVTGAITYIGAANWDAALFAYFERVRILNKMKSPNLLDGSNLFEKYFAAKMKDSAFDSKMFGTIPYYSDLSAIDAANDPLLKTYLIDNGVIGLASKVYYPSIVNYFDERRYSIPSQLIPGISYDVYYKNVCYDKRHKHEFKVVFNGLIAVAPAGCTGTDTGILDFTCGVTP